MLNFISIYTDKYLRFNLLVVKILLPTAVYGCLLPIDPKEFISYVVF